MADILKNKYICIFGGGAIRGLAYLGVLKALQEEEIEVGGYAGSSVGAVFALYSALGYSYDELREITKKVNSDLFKDVRLNLAKSFAISKGEYFLDWLRQCVEKKFYGESYENGKNQPVTFKDIDTDLYIITTNINGGTPFVFSKYTTPDFEVALAVRISTSMPGLFEPFKYEGNVLIDGDMMKSWPMWRINDLLCPNDCRIIEFRLEGDKFWPNVKNSVEYLNAVFATMSNFATDYIMQTYQPKDKFDYVKIDTRHILPVQFDLPENEREKLVSIGYESTKNYFTTTLLNKKKNLLPYYKVLLNHLIKIKNHLHTNNVSKAKDEICSMFVYLCEAKRYIDTAIYDNIVKFKTYFFESVTESLFFHRTTLKNKRQIEFYLNNLNDEVLEKCLQMEDYIKRHD